MENQTEENIYEVVESMKAPYEDIDVPVTLVIGCGGAGNNVVNFFHQDKPDGVTTIGINTDEKHLKSIDADKKIYIGKTITRGDGAGGHVEIGQQAARLAVDSLRDVLKGSDIVFLVAGLGGGTGLGATPIIGEIAKEEGAVVIGIGIMPFAVETQRRKRASRGLQALKEVSESTILLDNNKLLEIAPELSAVEGLNVMNRMISKVILSTRSTLIQTISATKNLEFSEVIGDMRAGEIEENQPQEAREPALVAPIPLHAGIQNHVDTVTPQTEYVGNNPGDLL